MHNPSSSHGHGHLHLSLGSTMDHYSELRSLATVSVAVAMAMSYARFAASRVPAGIPRLAALLPVISLLPLLPFSFSSLHLRGVSAFFLSWLSLFKLLLLSFGLGPLHPSLPLLPFLLLSSLPVNLRNRNPKPPHNSLPLLLSSSIKALLLALLIPLYRFKPQMHPYLLLSLYCAHFYLAIELVFAFSAVVVGGALRVDLEPQFNKPYLATSLGDFWGRRWNLTVSAALRPAVYDPVRRSLGTAAAALAAFLVSGVMHEAMFCYATLRPPTGEVAAFFALHGVLTAAEGVAKRSRWWAPLPPWVATPITVGFVVATALGLFFKPLVSSGADERLLEECDAILRFLKGTTVFSRLVSSGERRTK